MLEGAHDEVEFGLARLALTDEVFLLARLSELPPNPITSAEQGSVKLAMALTAVVRTEKVVETAEKIIPSAVRTAEAASEVAPTARNVENYVYRAIRPDEFATIEGGEGILRGNGGTTATQHVLGVKHANDPFVSTTNSLESAQFFATHGGTQPAGTIIRIDLNKVTNPIFDVSNPTAASSLLMHPRAVNFSVAHGEVLIKGGVNPEAISIFKP